MFNGKIKATSASKDYIKLFNDSEIITVKNGKFTSKDFYFWSNDGDKFKTFEEIEKYFDNANGTIKFELVEEEKVFIKADFKTGDWIVKRNGDLEQVLLNTPFGDYTVAEKGSNGLSGKNDNLTSILDEMFDIMKVMRPNCSGHLGKGNCKDGTVVFDREKGIGCEKPKPEYKFEIGDKVEISESGQICSSYDEFVKENSPKYISNFIEDGYPNTQATFKIVGKGMHTAYAKKPTYVIQDVNSRQVFVFCEEGLKSVEE